MLKGDRVDSYWSLDGTVVFQIRRSSPTLCSLMELFSGVVQNSTLNICQKETQRVHLHFLCSTSISDIAIVFSVICDCYVML